MRRILLVLLVLVVVGGVSWAAYQATAGGKEPPPPDYEVYTVATGDIASTVTATGSIEPTDEVELSFRGAGRVAELLVKVGDKVEVGQVLARLESDDLKLARDQAGVGLRIAKARLTQTLRPADDADIAASVAQVASAKASLAAARASYQSLVEGPNPAQRRSAEAAQDRARAVLQQAQSAYDQVAHLPNVAMMPQSLQLQQATIDYEVAKANVENTLAAATDAQKANASAQIAQAQAAVAQAEAALARLQRGALPEDIEVLAAQVEQSQIALDQADLGLKNVELTAPIAGTVGDISIREGEFPNPGRPAIALTGAGGYDIELNVDEIDIPKVAVGQRADISLDALPDAKLTGVIGRIAPVAGSSDLGSSIVTYKVTIDVDPTDQPLRPGLTATVIITTDQAQNVVVLPNRVIRIDRDNGQPYVEKLVNGVPERVDIQTGLRNEQFSEVYAGVQAGDELAVRRTGSGEVLRQQFFGG